MTKEQERKYLIWGGVIAGVGLLYWWWSNQQSSNAATTTTAATTTATPATDDTTQASTSAIQATTSSAPVTNTDPTQSGAMAFNIEWVAADNQQGAYNVIFLLAITNNTSIPQTLQNITGTATFVPIAEAYAGDSRPTPYTGILGTVNDSTTVTIAAGQTASKIYVVDVPKTSATNLYVANLAYIMADPATRNLPFEFAGTAKVSNDTININLVYDV